MHATLRGLGIGALLVCGAGCFRVQLATMGAGESDGGGSGYSLQIASFVALVALQTTAILLFKVCQEHGAYTFSPASSIAMTEMLKYVTGINLIYGTILKKRHIRAVSYNVDVRRRLNI